VSPGPALPRRVRGAFGARGRLLTTQPRMAKVSGGRLAFRFGQFDSQLSRILGVSWPVLLEIHAHAQPHSDSKPRLASLIVRQLIMLK